MKNWSRLFKNKKIVASLIVLFCVVIASYLLYSRYTQVLPDAALYFLNDAKLPSSGQKVLVFSPHPDDESIAAGGYIFDASKAGAKVYIVLVTDGDKHHLKATRYEEFKKATSILGVPNENLVFLNYPDGRLKKEDASKVSDNFKHEIDNIAPDFVIYPNTKDTHPDHAQTGKIVENILKDEKFSGTSYQYLVHNPHFPQPKKYDPSRNLMPPISLVTFDKEWQRYMLSNEAIDEKTRAVFTYKSQLKVPFLRSLILSSIRKNELFSLSNKGGL